MILYGGPELAHTDNKGLRRWISLCGLYRLSTGRAGSEANASLHNLGYNVGSNPTLHSILIRATN